MKYFLVVCLFLCTASMVLSKTFLVKTSASKREDKGYDKEKWGDYVPDKEKWGDYGPDKEKWGDYGPDKEKWADYGPDKEKWADYGPDKEKWGDYDMEKRDYGKDYTDTEEEYKEAYTADKTKN